MADLSRKITTRNILALATAGVFLWAIVVAWLSPDSYFTQVSTVAEGLDSKTTAFIVGGAGGSILGIFVAVVKDIYQFFFRKKPVNEPSS